MRRRIGSDRPLLTFQDIADRLKVSVRTVRRMVAAGLPVENPHGSVYRVSPAAQREEGK